MKTPKVLLCLFVLQLCFDSFSQVQQAWIRSYNGPLNQYDYAYSVATDNSGNVYVTGSSSGGASGMDYATIKYNSAGVQQWVQRYNGPGNDEDFARSIVVDVSGNVYVTGISLGAGSSFDFATIKYNSSGVQQWVQRYNGTGDSSEYEPSMSTDNSGNVYVTGGSLGNGTGLDYATIKYNSSGVQEWVQRYNGQGNGWDQSSAIAVDNLGNVYVTGRSGTQYSDYCTIKYNNSGNQQWIKYYNGTGDDDDAALSIAVDNSGNVFVTGVSPGAGTFEDYATVKYNSSGIEQWVKRYNGPGNDWDIGYLVAVSNIGNVYVTGRSQDFVTSLDYATIAYNTTGPQKWAARYNGPGNDFDGVNSMAIDNFGNVYVTGYSLGSGTSYDMATLKYDTNGTQLWVERFSGPGSSGDYAYSIAVDNSGNVYVTGESNGTGNYDFVTIKYTQIIGITPISNEVPVEFSLSQNYPNPFNPMTNFEFRIADFGLVNLIIFDILGREVETLVNEQLEPGTYEVDFDGSKLASGVYYYQLTAGDYTETKKMVLMK